MNSSTNNKQEGNEMEFAKGYEHGFMMKNAESNDEKYMKGYNLGVKQKKRVIDGTNTKFSSTKK